jgi:hypothetical protein
VSKDKAVFASTMNERNIADIDFRVCHYRIRNNVLKTYFILGKWSATTSVSPLRD